MDESNKLESLGISPARLLVFVEQSSRSNVYHQVLLDKEEFEKISLLVGEIISPQDHTGARTIAMNISSDEFNFPDLQEIYG